MGLSFEHARGVGTRASEKKIVEWWGSAKQHTFDLKPFKNYFRNKEPTPPKPYWIASKQKASLIINESTSFHLTEDEIVESSYNDADDLICNENLHTRNSDVLSGNHKDQTCSEIDYWFDQLLHDQRRRNSNNDATSSNARRQMEKLNYDLKQANKNAPQHDLNELCNQLLCHERLHLMHERNELKNCMLSVCLFVTKDHRKKHIAMFRSK